VIALILFVAGLFSLALGGMVVIGQPRKILSWVFACLTLSTALWVIFVGIFWSSQDLAQLLPFAQTYYLAAAMIAPLMLILVMLLTGVARKAVYVAVALPALATAIALSTLPDWLIAKVSLEPTNHVYLHSDTYIVYVIYFVIYYLAAVVYALYVSGKVGKASAIQLKSIALAYGVAGAIGMFFNLFLPAAGNYSLIWVGPLCLFIFVPMVYLAIRKHRLFDVRVTAVSTLAYIFSLCVLALVYLGLTYLISLFLGGVSEVNAVAEPVNMLLALGMALLFQPVRQFFDKATEKVFFHNWYDTSDLISRIGDVVTSTVDLKTLLNDLAQAISDTLQSSGITFIAFKEGVPTVVCVGEKAELSDSEVSALVRYIENNSGMINVGSAVDMNRRTVAIYSLLAGKRVALAVPLIIRKDVVGVMLVSKSRGGGYGKHDIETIQALTDELSIAIQNTISLQEVRDLNTTLEERVAIATRELRRSNEELKELDKTKDEFISMASHQLRTPLTSIKGYISMVLDGDVGDVNEQQHKLLSEAFTSSERMVHLISDFLNVSRIQTGKFIVDRQPTDLAELVEEEIESMRSIAESHDTLLVLKVAKNIPTLNVDGEKIRQVIMNFVDNAIFYSRVHSTIVIKLMRKSDEVVLEVHDQGIGVPADVQKRLFTKFFRADNARRQRPDGTGVGLFLAKKVITAQNGKMIFESTEGKGSVFGFRLPIRTPK